MTLTTPPFDTVLIANRGEIALRVARTCRELGVRTVAVHSTADADSAVTRFADETIQIGPPAAGRSYRNAAAIMAAAARTGATAIHPGYGFLSEDPDFAEICESHGVTFIGPPARVLAELGDKARARSLMGGLGLPILPGTPTTVDSANAAREAADRIGYPLIVKAAAGGGGRAMAVVRHPREFAHAYRTTRGTAQKLFGDPRVYLERYLEAARHVEVQLIADAHGRVVELGDRDCSVQRRHQKLVEEAPAGLPPAVSQAMRDSVVHAARELGYVGAGTFEFLLNPEGSFYFMEVNCRIQVEHPVTEMVTGVDIVREQVNVAAGRPLGIDQRDVAPRGVSIECRVNAEDPRRRFAPAPGRLTEFLPPGGPFVRVDSHAFGGMTVTPHYDSLLAKVAVWAPDRSAALRRMDRALYELRVAGPGVRTTTDFLRDVLADPAFRAMTHTTALVEQLLGPEAVAS